MPYLYNIVLPQISVFLHQMDYSLKSKGTYVSIVQ